MSKHWHVKCEKCGYEAHLQEGTPETTQTLSDLNEDFSLFKIYKCEECKELLSINIHDKTTKEHCPGCKHKLKKIKVDDKLKCPKCKGQMHIEELSLK